MTGSLFNEDTSREIINRPSIKFLIEQETLKVSEVLDLFYKVTNQEDIITRDFEEAELDDIDLYEILNIEDVEEFYYRYYIPEVVDLKGDDNNKLTVDELKLYCYSIYQQHKMIVLSTEMEKLCRQLDSMGTEEKLLGRMELVDSFVDSKIAKEVNGELDS